MKNSQRNRQRVQALDALCKTLDITFTDSKILHQALTHTSYANESKNSGVVHNERLEFLGDAVLDLIISDYLFRRFPDLPEGELTKSRAIIVCEHTLSCRAAALGLGEYLLLGKGEMASGGRERISILADSFEAIIGAIYVDQGLQHASQFVLKQLHDDILLAERGESVQDYKTLLQEVVQKNSDSRIVYEITRESGPDHDKTFEVAVIINSSRLGCGIGRSKKEAEQQAAKQALIQLKVRER
ncbi:MAG: ribonuclease III [Veillonellales bacterium]